MRATWQAAALAAALILGGTAHAQEPAAGPPARKQEKPPAPQPPEVVNEVEGETKVLKLLPEGAAVKRRDVVVELDSARLRDDLTNQEIQVKRAEANYQSAMKTRQVAEIAVDEYLKGTYPQDLKTAEGEVELARSGLKLAEERKAEAKGKAEQASDLMKRLEQERLKAEISLQQAEEKLKVLKRYTRPKTEEKLKAGVDKATAEEQARQATLKLEQERAEKLRKQIAQCTLRAPAAGKVRYAWRSSDPAAEPRRLKEGDRVRYRQRLFRIEPAPAEAPAPREK